MNVDRRNRDRLVDAIRQYLVENATAFEFDDEIQKISDECDDPDDSDDPTVAHVARALWFYYDDLKDHKVTLSKEEWDYFQRLILLLQSDAHIVIQICKRWSVTQLVAGVAFLAFAVCAAQLGIGYHLFAVAIPFGLVSIGLFRLQERLRWRNPASEQIAMVPFSRVSEIRAVRRRVPDFSKWKYPASLATRRIRSPVENFAILLPWYAVWLMMSPLALLVQMMPETVAQTHVVTC